MTYWINTVSRGHVVRGVAGGFTQANHGKPYALRRLARDDWIAFYSPKTDYPKGVPLQAFTAIGRVCDDEPYQAENGHWRRGVQFEACTEAPIRPLLDRLDFIVDKERWGYRFRFGLFSISQSDFEVVRAALTAVSTAPR